jgi:predicted RNA-binding Zn-ribbon protein involved in translation (DUF1610 family)
MPNKIKYKYERALLEKLVAESISIREVMTKLGITPISGGMHAHVKARIKREGIDTSHFKGKGANFGAKHVGGSKILSARELLVLNQGEYKTKAHRLRRALLEIGRLYNCYICGLNGTWREKPLLLEVEHINGNALDNREDNLQFLCPNCHSQTETFRKIKRK